MTKFSRNDLVQLKMHPGKTGRVKRGNIHGDAVKVRWDHDNPLLETPYDMANDDYAYLQVMFKDLPNQDNGELYESIPGTKHRMTHGFCL